MSKLSDGLLNLYVPKARRHLIELARRGDTVNYETITTALGTSRAYIGQVLDELNEQENAEGRPLLSALVVKANTGMPSYGFSALVRRLHPSLRGTDRAVWEAERNRVYAHYRSN